MMVLVRINKPPVSFTFLGIFLLAIMIPYIIKFNVGGSIENSAWFISGVVFFCVVVQILMYFLPECKCDAYSEVGE